MTETSPNVFNHLFRPQSIAVIGASNDPMKPGGRVTKSIKENGFKGDLWCVNPKTPSILDLPTFAGVADLPEGPELALIIIPAPGVLPTLKELAKRGTPAAIIMTAGFGEKGEEGKQEEQRILALAAETGMTVIGPNCSGFLTPAYAGKFAGIMPRVKPGAIDFISGSGATVDYVMEMAEGRGLTFSNVVNLGNSIQMGVEDILALLDENHDKESAKIILLYMEHILKPDKLLHHARGLNAKGCTIVAIKSGVTEAGAKAAASHTGAMARPDNAVQALFDKAGIVRVTNKRDLIHTASVLALAKGRIMGNRVCVLTDAGGPGVMLSDEIGRQGLVLANLSESTKQTLATILPPEASVGNPIDCLPSRTGRQVKEILDLLVTKERECIDAIVFITGNSGLSDNWEIYSEIMSAMDRSPIPIIPVFSSITTCADLLKKVVASGKIYFIDETAVGRALGSVVNSPGIFEPKVNIENYDYQAIEGILAESGSVLEPGAVKDLLHAAGFHLPPQVEIYHESELERACTAIGFPLVMKVIGPLHKSDMGGVKVGINSMEDAVNAWRAVSAIPEAQGALVQKMIDGLEVILGVSREQEFGHLVMFGLGGIYTEVLKDVRFALAPLSFEEARTMVRQIRVYPLLEGVRGQSGVSVDILADYLVRLGVLVTDFPQIKEIDLNPVKGALDQLYVVDARILKN